MSRPRLIADAGYQEITAVAQARAALPTDVGLALKWNVSRRRVQQIMRAARSAADEKLGELLRSCVVSNGESQSHTPAPCQKNDAAKS